MHMRRGVVLGTALAVLLYGCGTVINRTKQTVYLQSDPPGATAIINGVTRVTTPASVKLKRGKDHHISFEREGYQPTTAMIDRELSGWVWGNLLLGGLIGLAIDFGSGGAYKLEPETVMVTLQPVNQ